MAEEGGSGLNLPNALTVLRIILVPFFIGTLSYDYYGFSLVILAVAGITDVLDGIFARIKKQKTKLGTFLDPVADKALLMSSFIAMTLLDWIPKWLTIIAITRDVILIVGNLSIYFLTGDFKVSPTILGKATTTCQILLIALTLILINLEQGSPSPIFLWLIAILTVASGLHYIYKGFKIVR